MPLDTGMLTNVHLDGDVDRDSQPAKTFAPNINTGPDIGAALKATREFRGLTLESVAATTFIRRTHLEAIEEMRLSELPSRPFTIGYIRSYATALGLDGEAAVDRFKADEPVHDESLRGPVGVDNSRDPRVAAVVAGGLLIIGAIVLWNVAQRAMNEQAPPPSTAPRAVIARPAANPGGPVTLGAPLPAPVESTTPTPYKTPGLEAATAADGSADSAETARKLALANKASGPAAAPEDLAPTFVAKGPVYGAAPEVSSVTLQARKPASLIIRGPDGSVYFARQLAAGEAYRLPHLQGLTVDASEPQGIQVFVGGQSKGLLPAAQTLASKLIPVAPAAAAAVAAKVVE
jgi:cytoskeleton protein RodZ